MKEIINNLSDKKKIFLLRVLVIFAYSLVVIGSTYAYKMNESNLIDNRTISGSGECENSILYRGSEIYNTNLSVTDNYLEGTKGSVTLSKNPNCKIYTNATIYMHTDNISVSGEDNLVLHYKVMNGNTSVSDGSFSPIVGENHVLANINLTDADITYTMYLWVEHTNDLTDRYLDEATFAGYFYADATQTSTIH